MMNPVETAARLIDIPSPTGEEAGVALELERICIEQGWATDRQHISENRWNLFVNWDTRVRTVMCTHIDTVPGFFPSRTDSKYLYGRGACDTKGIIASMLAAGRKLADEGIMPSFLFVAGEETDSIGAKTARLSGRDAEFIIVGEPTCNILAHAHKGVLAYELRATGLAAHSGYPELGNSAIHVLLSVLYDILAADWGGSDDMGAATVNVGVISGGSAPNVMAENAAASLVHRIVDSIEKRRGQLFDIVDKRCEAAIKSENEPQRMYVPPGFESTAVAYGTDIPYLRALATPLLLGPGSIHDAHSTNERIEIAQILDAVELYSMMVKLLCGSQ